MIARAVDPRSDEQLISRKQRDVALRERQENMVEATKAEIKARLQDIHDRVQWIDDDEMAAIWFGNTVDHGHEKKTLLDEADKLLSKLNS